MSTYQPPKKNTAWIGYISLVSQANTKIMQASPTIAAGDFKVSTDGGALGNPATLPTVTPAAGAMVKISLSAAEMNGDNITVVCSDAAGAEWCDLVFNLQTAARQTDDLAYPATSGRSMVVDASGLVDANAVKVGPTGAGSAQTARDVGASVLLSTGTGTGQLDFTSGVVKANLAQILGTALTETAGLLAGGFKKFFNMATPTGTVNSIPDAVAGAANGLFIAGTNAATTANITGNLSGSVGSVTGAVGSVTGAVGSVTGAVGSVTGAVGSVTGAVGSVGTGGIAAASFAAGAIDAAAIATDAIGSAELAASAITEIQAGLSTLSEANIRTAVGLASANLDTQLGDLPTAAENADAVLDEDMTAHQAQGSLGQAIGDPVADADTIWGLVNTNLNATVGSRASQTSVDTIDDFLDSEITDIKTKTDFLPSATAGAAGGLFIAGSNAATTVNITGNLSGSVGSLTTNNDKIGYGLSTAAVQAIWDALTSALTTVGSIGKLLVDNINNTISSRSSHSAADVWASATRLLTAGTNIVLAKGTGVTGFNDLSAAQVNTEADTALTDYDAPTNAEMEARTLAAASYATATALDTVDNFIDTEIAAILLAVDTEVAAIKTEVDKIITGMVLDGAVYQFTANALELAPSGTGGDATAANQTTIINHLTGVKGATFDTTTDSLEAIRNRGDAAWITGSSLAGAGAITFTYTVTNAVGGAPLADVAIWVTTDLAGTNVIAGTQYSNVSGVTTWQLDAGTYYFWRQKAGINFSTQPDTEIVS